MSYYYDSETMYVVSVKDETFNVSVCMLSDKTNRRCSNAVKVHDGTTNFGISLRRHVGETEVDVIVFGPKSVTYEPLAVDAEFKLAKSTKRRPYSVTFATPLDFETSIYARRFNLSIKN